MSGLYPNYDDPLFNLKIYKKKEFTDFKYQANITSNIEEEFERLCNADFELTNTQLFLKNFLSASTPYNSLLLYHGLGTGKTCTAINIAEEVRLGYKQIGYNKRIIIVASPNVQDNFKTQLFDVTKLKNINNVWSMSNTCIGNTILNELFPNNDSTIITKEMIINSVNRFINSTYLFMGYIEFANYIKKLQNRQNQDKINNTNYLKNEFENRLIIIDEIHNIKSSSDKFSTYISKKFKNLVNNVKFIKLLFLTATPMFNDYKEIIWLINIMHSNDNRPEVKISDVFDDNGNFVVDKETGEEIGKNKFINISRGYVSYVRGENPYSFPYRIYPHLFSQTNSLFNKLYTNYPKYSPNNTTIKQNQKIEYTDLFINTLFKDSFQESAYYTIKNKYINSKKTVKSIKYEQISPLIQVLNFAFPTNDLRTTTSIFGSDGLFRLMNYNNNTFSYKPDTIKEYGKIFHPDNIQNYSIKFKSIYNYINNSEGVILVYSQYIEGSIIPFALMLEEMGFQKYNSNSLLNSNTKSIKSYKYIIISGNTKYSNNNEAEVSIASSNDNLDGSIIKVVIISKAGSEGIDFKFIRQVHILEPWYNLNRIEQIIGRAIRFCSHKLLHFTKRNTTIFLHTTLLSDENEESADLYLYRYSEKKAIKIAKVTRLLKQNSIDCLLNTKQKLFTEGNLNTTINILLSDKNTIRYKIGDKKNTLLCDFFDDCKYSCIAHQDPYNAVSSDIIDYSTFNITFLQNISNIIIDKIKTYFANNNSVIKIIDLYRYLEKYTPIYIKYSINRIITEKHIIYNHLNIPGSIVIFGEFIIFQPHKLYNNITLFDREHPLHYKHKSINFKINNQFNTNPYINPITEQNDSTTLSQLYTLYTLIFNNDLITTDIKIIKQAYSNNDWNILTNIAINALTENDFDIYALKYIICEHLFDNLIHTKKIKLISYLYSDVELKEVVSQEFLDIILYFIKQNIFNITINGQTYEAIMLQSNVPNINTFLYIYKDSIWSLATPTDISVYRDKYIYLANNVKTTLQKQNNFLGFIDYKAQEVYFKLIDLNDSKVKGFRCEQSNSKKITIISNFLFDLFKIDQNVLTKNGVNKKVKVIDLCIYTELLLRYANYKNTQQKIWFINTFNHLTIQSFLKNIK